MRLFIAGLAAVAAVAIATPSFAQQEAPPAAPMAKPKPGTTAYCNTLKTSSSRNACLKRVHAQATPKATPVAKGKPKKLDAAHRTEAQVLSPPQTIAVPPLPQKTI